MKTTWIKSFCKQFNIKVKFSKHLYAGGVADIKGRRIIINKSNLNRRDDIYMLHLICHEVCHILCYDYGKFINYHTTTNNINKQRKKLIRRIGLKAERYCDKQSWKMVRSFFPEFKDMPKVGSYFSPSAKKWYTDNYLNKYYKLKR